MDKIPAALQHKIDYIKALDIPTEQKSRRIAIAILDYWSLDASMSSWYLNDIASLIAGANTGDSKAQIKRVNAHISTLDALLEMGVNNANEDSINITGIAPEGMITGKAVKEIMDDVNLIGVQPSEPWPRVHTVKTSVNGGRGGGLPSTSGGEGGCGPDADSLGLVLGSKPAKINEATDISGPPSPRPSPPPMPPKRVICEDVKSPMSMANALRLQQLQVGFASIRSIPDPSKPIASKGRNKPDQHEHNLSRFLLAGSFSLCAAIGFVIGVALGGSL